MGSLCSKFDRRESVDEEANPIEKDLVALRHSKIPVIWVLGGPGSGKGTQCARLVERYNFIHIASGDLLRAEAASGSKTGNVIQEIMVKGGLVPREIVLDLLKHAMLANFANAKGYLVDGYPREVEQARDFEAVVTNCSMILYFDCSDEIMKERLLKRALSSGRADDNEETIIKRLETFHELSVSVIRKYAAIVARIHADASSDVIFQESCKHVDELLVRSGLPVPPYPEQ